MLPTPDKGKYVEFLFKKLSLEEYFKNKERYHDLRYDGDVLKDTAKALFSALNFSLRTQEQIFSQVCIVLKTIPVDRKVFPAYLIFLLSIRSSYRDLYNKIVNKQISGLLAINKLVEIPGYKHVIYEHKKLDR